jgi:hypothetical protein
MDVARTVERRTSPWIAFAAGAVAMLALALAYAAWESRDTAQGLVRAAAGAAQALPEVPRPTMPDAPRLPDAPTPIPK